MYDKIKTINERKVSIMGREIELEKLINDFDKFSYYLDGKLERDIEENRKGQFVIELKNGEGEELKDAVVKVKQISHEFKFGGTLFYLDQFSDEERRIKYADSFKELFNYAVAPLYWDTLEPEEGKPRFGKDSVFVDRRPPLDVIAEFCRENNIRLKGHCLMYNSFQPDWISEDNRELKMQIDRRAKAIAERYGDLIEDMDVVNEMLTIYKNCYKGNGCRNLQITDDDDYESWSFETTKKYFPYAKKFWIEGMDETFGTSYRGKRSFYYMMLEKLLREGVEVDGIGMQYHAFFEYEGMKDIVNPLRLLDVFDCYSKFGLPIQVSEVSIPSYSNEKYAEELQGELTKRLYKLWFGRKNCEGIVWWNLADGTAYKDENKFHAGLIDNNCNKKPAYHELKKLINSEWRTEFETKASGEVRFSGFYGDYEVTVTADGKRSTQIIKLRKENTGFDNRLCDFRSKQIML